MQVSANPRAEVEWIRSDGVRLTASQKYTLYSNAQDGYFSLSIGNVQPGDANEYFCVATNEGGQIQVNGKSFTNVENLSRACLHVDGSWFCGSVILERIVEKKCWKLVRSVTTVCDFKDGIFQHIPLKLKL